MKTDFIKVDKSDLYTPEGKEKMARAAELLREGEVVAFPRVS